MCAVYSKHWTTQYLSWESLEIIWSNVPFSKQGQVEWIAQETYRYVLNNMEDGDSTAYLGSLFQYLTPNKAKKKRNFMF